MKIAIQGMVMKMILINIEVPWETVALLLLHRDGQENRMKARTSIFALSGSEATHAPAAWRRGLLHSKIGDFGVKAGIGGFHPPEKRLAGKACNGVPA